MAQITNLMKAFFPMNNGRNEDDDVLLYSYNVCFIGSET